MIWTDGTQWVFPIYIYILGILLTIYIAGKRKYNRGFWLLISCLCPIFSVVLVCLSPLKSGNLIVVIGKWFLFLFISVVVVLFYVSIFVKI